MTQAFRRDGQPANSVISARFQPVGCAERRAIQGLIEFEPRRAEHTRAGRLIECKQFGRQMLQMGRHRVL
jgi:hypothetical protein